MPPPATFIDPALLQAFCETEYRVQGAAPFVMRVGQQCSELVASPTRYGTDCSAFITACNPYSQPLDANDNAERQARLAGELRVRNLPFEPGVGQHLSNKWPGEESFLVFGLGLEEAKALGAKVQQNALIWVGADGVPQLILLRWRRLPDPRGVRGCPSFTKVGVT